MERKKYANFRKSRSLAMRYDVAKFIRTVVANFNEELKFNSAVDAWHSQSFGHIYEGLKSSFALYEFAEDVLHVTKYHFTNSEFSIKTRVAALYLLYCLFTRQKLLPIAHVHLTIEEFNHSLNLIKKLRKDDGSILWHPLYCWTKLRTSNAFLFSCTGRPMGFECAFTQEGYFYNPLWLRNHKLTEKRVCSKEKMTPWWQFDGVDVEASESSSVNLVMSSVENDEQMSVRGTVDRILTDLDGIHSQYVNASTNVHGCHKIEQNLPQILFDTTERSLEQSLHESMDVNDELSSNDESSKDASPVRRQIIHDSFKQQTKKSRRSELLSRRKFELLDEKNEIRMAEIDFNSDNVEDSEHVIPSDFINSQIDVQIESDENKMMMLPYRLSYNPDDTTPRELSKEILKEVMFDVKSFEDSIHVTDDMPDTSKLGPNKKTIVLRKSMKNDGQSKIGSESVKSSESSENVESSTSKSRGKSKKSSK